MAKSEDRRERTKIRRELRKLGVKDMENDDNLGLRGVCLHIGMEYTVWFKDGWTELTYACGTLVIDEPTAEEIAKECANNKHKGKK